MTARAEPTSTGERITTLDAVRGVAVLGILTMNAVSNGLEPAAYFNIDASAPQSALDWLLGGIGEIFFDQKFMGLFSLLFGAGIVLFADPAEAKGRRPVLFSLWRNALLIGLRTLSPRTLIAAGILTVLSSAVLAAIAQQSVDATGAGLGTAVGTRTGRCRTRSGCGCWPTSSSGRCG